MKRIEISPSNVAIDRIEEKCTNCGMCLKTCKNINGLDRDCINCGQCILTCPTGALIPKYNYREVLNYINDTEYTVVVFTSPAVRVAIGDEFGYEPGEFLEGKMVSALKRLGFNYVFDTTFGADLTVMEEAHELIDRINKGNTPMFSSCCPSWVLYMNKYHSGDVKYLSTCKSPIAMQSEMIKSYFADMYDLDKDKIISVALTPCVSKKYERVLYPETDKVITTRELAMMIRESSIDFKSLENQEYDKLLGKGSSAGLIFGASGGVTEAILRTVYYMVNGEHAPKEFYHLDILRGEKNIKTAVVDMKKFKINLAVANKVSTVSNNYDELLKYDFIEVMSCPGGCIGGGGQPLVAINKLEEIRKKRIDSLYTDADSQDIQESFMNKEIQDAYISYISKNNVKLHTKKTLQETKNQV